MPVVVVSEAVTDDALDGFLRSVERRALYMLELSLQEREEALDVLQDVMIRFVQSYRHKPASQWPPLFHRVLNNALIDRMRARGRLRRRFWGYADDDPLETLASDRPGPAQHLAASDLGDSLVAALEELPLRQRQVLLLRTWEQLSVEATARALGIGEGSVKTHLSRARARLREVLNEHI